MNFLILHQNFPGQYIHAARHLVEQGHNVVAIAQPGSGHVDGVDRIIYSSTIEDSSAHSFVREFDFALQNGLLVARECETLKKAGFTPDLIIGHNGWGETLFVKDVWPATPLLAYFEFYYHSTRSDLDFDPEFPAAPDSERLVGVRNAVNLLGLEAANLGQTATRWQRDLYPARARDQIKVVHEGVDVDLVRPNASARMSFRGGLSIGADSEVITYCARNLEPYRGFPIFMRALPRVLRELPNARVVIVGGSGVSYGRRPLQAATWQQQLREELGDAVDWERVHFLGRLPFQQYLSVLQLSTVHVYLTYPFVLSWSFIEALSAGCCVIASKTAPVEEVAIDGVNAQLVDFFDVEALGGKIVAAIRHRGRMRGLRAAARETAVTRYDARRICLPQLAKVWKQLTGAGAPAKMGIAPLQEGSNMPEPVRLIIWDLDETFWRGTLTEGGVKQYIEAHHGAVVELARRGIMSSICSKNDFQVVETLLRDREIWDYFVFPSIDWTPKGPRVRAIVEAMQLRPATVLFIDDNPANLAEAAISVPGIQISDPSILQDILEHPLFRGKPDFDLTRLGQYRLLQKRSADKNLAGDGDETFLRKSDIRVVIDTEILPHIDRAIELLNRTNQLNFTKRRLPEDIAQARRQLMDELGPYWIKAGLIRVVDNYGDYGYCGFYRMSGSELLDYCFSCRILGMGVETWFYDRLGRPALNVSGETLVDLSLPRHVDWVRLVEDDDTGSGDRAPKIPEVRLRGGCETEAIAHYFRLAADKIHAEVSGYRDWLLVQKDSSTLLPPSREEDAADFHAAMAALGYAREDFASALFAPAVPGTILIYSPWADVNSAVYRHRTAGFAAPVPLDIPGDLTTISNDELALSLDTLQANEARRRKVRSVIDALRADYVQEPRLPISEATTKLAKMFAGIPAGAHLFLVLPHEFVKWDNRLLPRDHVIAFNQAIRGLCEGYPEVELIEMNDIVAGPEDLQGLHDHFHRSVYYRVYRRIVEALDARAERVRA